MCFFNDSYSWWAEYSLTWHVLTLHNSTVLMFDWFTLSAGYEGITMSRFKKTVPLAGLGLTILAGRAKADIQTGYLYVSDYGLQALDRFAYDYDTTSHVISHWRPYGLNGSSTNAQFINADVKEGLQGTATDIIVVATGGSSLDRYGIDGHRIGTIQLTLNGAAHTLSSVGNVQITSDGKYMYAPESGGLGYIDKIDLSNGKIIARAQFAGAHDVLILPNGNTISAAQRVCL